MIQAKIEEQLKMLIELQGLDTHILKLKREIDSFPEQIKVEEDRYSATKVHLKALEDGVKTLQVKRKEKEVELQSKEEHIKKLQSQMYQVKTNKEYTTFGEEIGRIKADNSIIEEDILKLFDVVDVENKKIAEEKERLKGEEAKFNEIKKRLGDEAERLTKDMKALESQRSELVSKVDKTILVKYERLLVNRDGLALARVANESCQGCFRIMPPQVIDAIRMKKDIIVCEYCARLLYIEE